MSQKGLSQDTSVLRSINFVESVPVIANGQLVPLTIDPTLQLSVWPSITGTGLAHLVLDITGYFQEP